MRVERIEANPEPIVKAVIVVPTIAISNRTIDSDMFSKICKFGHRKTRFDRFEPRIVDRFLPSVETVMDAQSCAGQIAAIGYNSSRGRPFPQSLPTDRRPPYHTSLHHFPFVVVDRFRFDA
jgi:hypothetical protein